MCPVPELQYARAHTAAGVLMERILDLDFDLGKLQISWAELTLEETMALRILSQERDRFRSDMQRRSQEEEELRRANERAQRRSGGGFE
jgi:hypothetical protein